MITIDEKKVHGRLMRVCKHVKRVNRWWICGRLRPETLPVTQYADRAELCTSKNCPLLKP